MAKPGDIIYFGKLDGTPQLCLVFDHNEAHYKPIEDRPQDLRNLILECCREGGIAGEDLLTKHVLCSIKDLNLYEVILAVLKEKGLL